MIYSISLFILDINLQIYVWKHSLTVWIPFHSIKSIFWWVEVLGFNVHCISIFPLHLIDDMSYQDIFCHPEIMKLFSNIILQKPHCCALPYRYVLYAVRPGSSFIISFIWTSSWPGTIFWKGHSFHCFIVELWFWISSPSRCSSLFGLLF